MLESKITSFQKLIFCQAIFRCKRWNIYPQSQDKLNDLLSKRWNTPHTSKGASAALCTMKWVYFSGQSKNEVFHIQWTQWSLFLADATLPTTEEKNALKYYNHGTHIKKKKRSWFCKQKEEQESNPALSHTARIFSLPLLSSLLRQNRTWSWCREEHILTEVPILGHSEVWSAGPWAELYFHPVLRPLEPKAGINIFARK